MKTGRILGGAGIVFAFTVAGCAGAPPRYVSQYALPSKLPGAFTLSALVAPQAPSGYTPANYEWLRKEIERDLRENVFDGQAGNTWKVEWNTEQTFYPSRVKAPTIKCSSGTPSPIAVSLSISSGSTLAGNYVGKAEHCFRNAWSSAVITGQIINAALLAMEDAKKQIAADRDNILARMNEGGAGVLARRNTLGKLNVAVSDLSAESVSQGDASIVADWLRGALVSAGTYTVVERSAMQKILTEQAFQQTGCTSQECAVKLGKMLNVQRMIVGSFGKFLDSYVLNVRVVDIETGQVVYSDSARGATTAEVETNIKALASRLSR